MTARLEGSTETPCGIEFEHKWRIDGRASTWRPDHPEDGDAVLRGVLRGLGSSTRPDARVFTFAQSGVLFDTPTWRLAEAEVSLSMLVNYGELAGRRWLMLKETVRWLGGRREALEMGAELHSGDLATASTLVQRLDRRLSVTPRDLTPYATITQRRRKCLWPDGDQTLSFALDSTLIQPRTGSHDYAEQSWWLEVEANDASDHALWMLANARDHVVTELGFEETRTTKPVEAARVAGWTSC